MHEQITSTFRISIYLLMTVAVVCIGFAEYRLFPHFFTLPLLFLAYRFWDRQPWLTIENYTTGFLGFIALLVATLEFQQGRVNIEMRILAASHLLAYFSWITLLLRKDVQQYWWMLALSALMMAVSASLTTSAYLGLAVVCFLFLAIWTLTLFTAYRGTAALRIPEGPKQVTLTAKSSVADVGKKGARVSALESVSRVRGGFHFNANDNWLGRKMVGSIIFMSIWSVVVGMVIFTMTPRIWIGNWQLPSTAEEAIEGFNFGKKVSGFTDEVKLGDLGQILENPTPVLYVQFEETMRDQYLTYDQMLTRFQRSDLLFRGTALSNYNNGNWDSIYIDQNMAIPNTNAPRNAESVRLNYELEPLGRPTLFVMQPISFGNLLSKEDVFRPLLVKRLAQEVFIDENRNLTGMSTLRYETVITRDEDALSTNNEIIPVHPEKSWQRLAKTISTSIESEYQAGSQTIVDDRTEFVEFTFDRRGRQYANNYDEYFRSLLQIDRSQLKRLIKKAEELCASDSGEPLSPEERCQKILYFLRDSGQFRYSLNMEIQDPTVDPVEDFLFNRKAGHCEYFASTMAIMLRGVGVPARIVNGFKGGRWSENEQQLVVEQRNAHAWVEALVDGKWLVLDPTTASDEVDLQSLGDDFSFASIWGYINNFWQTHVIGVTLARQQNSIYEPIQKRVDALSEQAQLALQLLRQKPTGQKNSGRWREETIFYGLLIVMLLLIAVFVFLYIYYRPVLYRLLGFMNRKVNPHQQQMLIFFRRFLEIAARQGMRKSATQTAREFAQDFEQKFSLQLQRSALQSLPATLADSYYRVRYRGDQISAADLDHWKQQLDALVNALRPEQTKI